MKFKVEIPVEIDNDDLLEMVNEYQENNELELFETIEEVPFELILTVFEDNYYMFDEVRYVVEYKDFIITKVNEKD